MKHINHILLAFIFVIGIQSITVANDNCTLEINADVYEIYGGSVSPGDVICLLAGNKDFLFLKNIQGTQAQPITIVNKGGAVIIDTDHSYGIKFDNCKHIIFAGDGYQNEEYGIQVKRVTQGSGMSIDNKSTNIEIHNIEIANTGLAGIYAKTDPYQGDCNNLVTRDNFTMYDLIIHDCYLHDIADEGFYIGSSKYTGQTVYQCDDIVVLPHVIEGVEIYNNILENIGWDGIQVSSSPVDCSIYHNIIRNDSYDEEYGQMSGILIGGGSVCDCFNNKIIDGKGDGIDVFGMGDMKIFNNLIVRAGKTYKPNDPVAFKSGIYVGFVEGALLPNAEFKIYNNTIVSPKSFGVTYNNSLASMGYVINNLITNPGYYSTIGNDAYVNLMVSNNKVTQNNNFLRLDNSSVKFKNLANDNYDLKPNSAAVNFGASLTSEGITFDIDDRYRPFHTYFDAGAYECDDPHASVNDDISVIKSPYPNPVSKTINIPVASINNQRVNVFITSMVGVVVYNEIFNATEIVDGNIKIDVKTFKKGSYVLSVEVGNNCLNRLIIIDN